MKSKKLVVFSIVSLLLSLLLFIVSLFLSVGNASSIMAFSLFSAMKEIYILRLVSICFLVFGVFILLLSKFSGKLKKTSSKQAAIILSVLLLVSVIGAVLSVIMNYSGNSVYGYNVVEDSDYIAMFPYYDEMKNKSNDEVYTVIDENEIFSSKYVGLQSSFDTNEGTILYDVKYLQSKNDILMAQFVAQNEVFIYGEPVDKGKCDEYSYSVYKNDNSYSVIFEAKGKYFVFYLLKYDYIVDNQNTESIIDNAYVVLTNIEGISKKGF